MLYNNYLDVKNLKVSYGKNLVINDISFAVKKGELLCILGESGCGKTTTLNAIGGFIDIDSGKIFIDDEDISNLPPSDRPTSTVFQSYGLFPNMTVIENVTYGLKIRGINKRMRVEEGKKFLDIVSLSEIADKNVESISGGQKQRVALARALIVNPKVCLLDEPLSNLDFNLRIKMRKEIKSIQEKLNITMVFVTHDIEEAISIADRIMIMHRGKILAIGKPIDIFKNEENEYIKNFLNVSSYKIDENNKFYKVL